jgi:hypothetical protein
MEYGLAVLIGLPVIIGLAASVFRGVSDAAYWSIAAGAVVVLVAAQWFPGSLRGDSSLSFFEFVLLLLSPIAAAFWCVRRVRALPLLWSLMVGALSYVFAVLAAVTVGMNLGILRK